MFGTVRPPITMMRWSGRSWEVEYHRSTWVLSAVSTQSHEPVGGQGVNVLKDSHMLFNLLHCNAKTVEDSKRMSLIHSEFPIGYWYKVGRLGINPSQKPPKTVIVGVTGRASCAAHLNRLKAMSPKLHCKGDICNAFRRF